MANNRVYTSRRSGIVTALVDKLKTIDGSSSFVSSVFRNVYPKLHFITDIKDFPTVCVVAGSETRLYQAAEYKDRFLNLKIIIFVDEENPLTKLDAILEDIETVVEENGRLAYEDKVGATQYTHDITVLSITTDEGTLEPLAIGEMEVRVRY
jgi:hypothetical protein